MYSTTQKLSNPLFLGSYEFFITLTCLIKSLATGGLTQFPALLPSLEVGSGGAQSSNLPITWPGSTGNDLPSSGGESQSHLIDLMEGIFGELFP